MPALQVSLFLKQSEREAHGESYGISRCGVNAELGVSGTEGSDSDPATIVRIYQAVAIQLTRCHQVERNLARRVEVVRPNIQLEAE